MYRIRLSSPSGISPEEQVFRKTSSIMRFGNLVLSDHRVTVTAERQLSLEWGGRGEASACEPGDGKISIAVNEEPELQRGNSITAFRDGPKPLGMCNPAPPMHPSDGCIQAMVHGERHSPATPGAVGHLWGWLLIQWWLPSNSQTRHRGSFYH